MVNRQGRENPSVLEFKITPRERDVLELISKGYSYREIAEKLFISEETVISHRKHLLSKFKVHNSAELIRATPSTAQLVVISGR